MILYRAVCSNHNFESNLYQREIDAKRAASRHRSTTPAPHNLKILEVYVPDDAIQVQSEKEY